MQEIKKINLSLVLNDVAKFISSKIEVSEINVSNYISTENMLPNKGGITTASSLPDTKSVREYIPKDILINNIRPYFKKIWYSDMEGGCSNDIYVLRSNENYDSKFLYYVLSSDDFFSYVMANAKGTKMPRGDKKAIQNYKVPNFSIDKQKKISSFLGEIDRKIEINKKLNKNLEKTLITIFNSWFINFENYDNSKGMKIDESYGEIPVDWSVEMLEDYVDFVTGVEPGSKNYHEKPEPHDIPFLRVGDLGSRDNGVFIDPSLSKNKILKYDDIVLSLDATIGIVKMGLEGAYSTGMRKLVIKNDNINQPFLYCLVKSNRIQRIIETFATGTTILHAGKSIKHMNFVLSDKKTMDDFGKIGNPIISIILTNLKEIEYLTNLRDTLLPKLMSGEIDVSKINCDLELKYNYMKYLFNQIHTPMSKSVV